MIRILIISSLVVLGSCAGMKERKAAKSTTKAPMAATATGNENENAPPREARPAREEDMMGIQGTVRLNTPGCPVMIEVIKGDLFSTAYPVNLDKQYQKEGLLIKFDFAPSRAPSPESCTADMVISVSNVEIIK